MEHSASREPFVGEMPQEYDYSLVFCNPKRPKSRIHRVCAAVFRTDRFPIGAEEAKVLFYRIFRMEMEESQIESTPYLETLKRRLDIALNDSRIRSTPVEFRPFAILVLDCIYLLLVEELGLEVEKPYISKINDEGFFDIKASDDILKQEAIRISYRLQFKQFEIQSKPYQHVPPYVAFHEGADLEDKLKSYEGSVFNDIDRIRLIASILDRKLDRRELYSLGILLSEVYLSCKTGDKPTENNIPTVDQMRMTCGERTALLYSWHQFFYTWWSFPGCIGLVLFAIRFSLDLSENHFSIEWNSGMGRSASPMYLVFAVILFIYSSIVLAKWKRKESYLAWHWGTTEVPVIEAQRLEYPGEWEYDDVTGLNRKARQSELSFILKRTVSFVLIIVLILADIGIIAIIFAYNTTLRSTSDRVWGGFLNAIQARLMGFSYSSVAQWLNDWEKIEFERDYYNALCIKQFLFQFVNAYASLFYIAFVKSSTEGCIDDNCLYELNIQFLTIFGVFWGVNLAKTIFSLYYQKIVILWMRYRYNLRLKDFNQDSIEAVTLTESEKQ